MWLTKEIVAYSIAVSIYSFFSACPLKQLHISDRCTALIFCLENFKVYLRNALLALCFAEPGVFFAVDSFLARECLP